MQFKRLKRANIAIDIKPTLVLNRLNLMDSANENLQKG